MTDTPVEAPSENKVESPKETNLSKKEQERIERIQREGTRVYNQLSQQFTDFFILHDNPESVEVTQKAKQVSVQWKMYCQIHGLKSNVNDLVENHCNALLEEYKALKEGKAEEVADPVASGSAQDAEEESQVAPV